MRLARNLADAPFPIRMNNEIRRNTVKKIFAAVKNSPYAGEFDLVDLSAVSSAQAYAYAEQQLISRRFARQKEQSAFLLSKDGSASVMLCEEDHIRLQVRAAGQDLEGAYAKADAKQAPSDEEYFEAVQPYLSHGRIGMFMLAKLADKELVRGAADAGLYFLRVGADAGDGAGSVKAVAAVKEAGLTCRYSLMKGYVLPAAELAKEAKLLQDAGVDRITIMDSAGTMFPDQTTEYVKALKDSVTIPVGFHGHSNLGLSQANALAAVAAGADEIDCGLLGMARSAGNCATELAAATLKREGYLPEVDLFGLLHYLEDYLIPTMESYHYHVAIAPVELMLGLSGCHSSFLPMFRKVAQEEGVSLLKLIAEASTIDRKAPSESLLRDVAKKLK